MPAADDPAVVVFAKPDQLKQIYKAYFKSGAGICRTSITNFSETSPLIRELYKQGAQIAKTALAEMTMEEPRRPRFVAGAVGPGKKGRAMAWQLQIGGLVCGGVDMLWISSIDALDSRAAMCNLVTQEADVNIDTYLFVCDEASRACATHQWH